MAARKTSSIFIQLKQNLILKLHNEKGQKRVVAPRNLSHNSS